MRAKGKLGEPAPDGQRKVKLLFSGTYGADPNIPGMFIEHPPGTVMDLPEALAARWEEAGICVVVD